MPNKPLIITNFAGRLTRQNFGDINSGFAKYDSSWGYNPFFSPGSLTWMKAAGDLSSIITDGSLILAAQSRVESGVQQTYAISNQGTLWKITGEGGGATLLTPLSIGTPTFNYGGTLRFFGGKIYIGHDKGVTRINFDGSSETQIGTWDSSHYVQNTYRPLQDFSGSLYVGNTTDGTSINIGQIDSTLTITNYSKLSPPLGTVGSNYVRDLDITPDFTYLSISVSNIAPENMAAVNDTTNTASGTSEKFYWNGQDAGYTNGVSLPGFGITALNTFGPYEYSMMYDTFGTALYEEGKKRWTLRNMKSPFPNGVESTGNFLTWVTPEMYWNQDTQSGRMMGGLFYYGSLDDEVGAGLWRLNRWTSSNAAGQIYQAPFNHFTTNRYVSTNSGIPPLTQVDSNGTHLFSYMDYIGSGTTNKFYYFYAAPPDDSPVGWVGACAGVYETQTQLFSQKQTVKQVRVYTSPTVASNGFNVDIIGSNGTIVSVTNPMTYTFAAGTDDTKLQGAQTRIDFNPNMAPDYGIGIRITNTGGNNMSINKIEIDMAPMGK